MDFSKIFDQYEIKARLFPGLLVLLPITIYLIGTLGPDNKWLAAIVSALTISGGPLILQSIVRSMGHRSQNQLFKHWGGKPTTILLRHSDTRLIPLTKKRYHEIITSKLKIKVPSAEEEASNRTNADGIYMGVTEQLIHLTRDHSEYPLVFKELISYGFNRNAYGIRWIGITTCICTFMVMLIQSEVILLKQPYVNIAALNNISTENAMSLLFSAILFIVWILHFNEKTVKQAGFNYAERLFEAIDSI